MSIDNYVERILANALKENGLSEGEDGEKLRSKIESYIYDRSLLELWCDKHNHKLSFIRTILSSLNLVTATLVALKVFEVI
jgi:hypothetical protein